MRLLQVNSVYKIASTGRTTYELENFMLEKGWECFAAYADGPKKESNYIMLGSLNSHRVHSFLARKFDMQGFFSYLSSKKLIKYIERIEPDIVHLRNLHSNYISIIPLLRYLGKKNIPVVITLHDFWFFTGGCCFHTDYSCNKWKEGNCGQCPQAQRESLIDMSKSVQQKKMALLRGIKSLAVVGVSEWTTSEFREFASKMPNAKTLTIYNWIDFDNFYPRDVERCNVVPQVRVGNNIVLGVATSWSNIKGLDDFISVAKILGENYSIVLVGRMPSDIVLPSNIISLGEIRDVTKLAELYSIANVFVSFSTRETFGKVIAEAMSCGCPAVVYDVTACGEIVGKDCGFAIKAGDVDQAVEHITEICNSDKDSYKEKCLRRTRELFSLRDNAEKYIHLYEELING